MSMTLYGEKTAMITFDLEDLDKKTKINLNDRKHFQKVITKILTIFRLFYNFEKPNILGCPYFFAKHPSIFKKPLFFKKYPKISAKNLGSHLKM
jgi:hypothetical protein